MKSLSAYNSRRRGIVKNVYYQFITGAEARHGGRFTVTIVRIDPVPLFPAV